jgi:hypothetical protein
MRNGNRALKVFSRMLGTRKWSDRRRRTPKVGFFKLSYLKEYTIHKLDL